MTDTVIRYRLVKELFNQGVFWSYKEPENFQVSDAMIIENTLLYLDIDRINSLFKIFTQDEIKLVWEKEILRQEPYYHSLNLFLAWFYFGISVTEEFIEEYSLLKK